jgi:hypothetical protein
LQSLSKQQTPGLTVSTSFGRIAEALGTRVEKEKQKGDHCDNYGEESEKGGRPAHPLGGVGIQAPVVENAGGGVVSGGVDGLQSGY